MLSQIEAGNWGGVRSIQHVFPDDAGKNLYSRGVGLD
jgi:hypothetical protein